MSRTDGEPSAALEAIGERLRSGPLRLQLQRFLHRTSHAISQSVLTLRKEIEVRTPVF